VQIIFTEDDLTTLTTEALRESEGLTVNDVRVRLVPGQAIITGRTPILGVFSVPVRVVTTPVAVDGRPIARVERIELGGLSVPENFRRSVEDTLTEALDPERLGLRGKVTNITVTEGTLTVDATLN